MDHRFLSMGATMTDAQKLRDAVSRTLQSRTDREAAITDIFKAVVDEAGLSWVAVQEYYDAPGLVEVAAALLEAAGVER